MTTESHDVSMTYATRLDRRVQESSRTRSQGVKISCCKRDKGTGSFSCSQSLAAVPLSLKDMEVPSLVYEDTGVFHASAQAALCQFPPYPSIIQMGQQE